jgi:hypothetical protein
MMKLTKDEIDEPSNGDDAREPILKMASRRMTREQAAAWRRQQALAKTITDQ